MTLVNKTNRKTLAERVRSSKSIWVKARGLMFTTRKSIERGALIFEFKGSGLRSLHMMFVFYPIDVLFLDERKRVVETKKNFRPFTVYYPKEKSKYVIELPAGVLDRTRTSPGDSILW